MILDFFLLIILQPIFSSLFFFLAPLFFDFFKARLKELNFKIFIYSFLTDLIFLKPLGFFLILSSFPFLFLSFVEKFLNYNKFHQRIFFLILFNFIFLIGFFYLSGIKANIQIFAKIFLFNLIFQIIYLEIKNIFLAK